MKGFDGQNRNHGFEDSVDNTSRSLTKATVLTDVKCFVPCALFGF